MFNNEPEFQRLYKPHREETNETPTAPKDEPVTDKNDTLKYELGKTVSTGAFNIKVGEKTDNLLLLGMVTDSL